MTQNSRIKLSYTRAAAFGGGSTADSRIAPVSS